MSSVINRVGVSPLNALRHMLKDKQIRTFSSISFHLTWEITEKQQQLQQIQHTIHNKRHYFWWIGFRLVLQTENLFVKKPNTILVIWDYDRNQTKCWTFILCECIHARCLARVNRSITIENNVNALTLLGNEPRKNRCRSTILYLLLLSLYALFFVGPSPSHLRVCIVRITRTEPPEEEKKTHNEFVSNKRGSSLYHRCNIMERVKKHATSKYNAPWRFKQTRPPTRYPYKIMFDITQDAREMPIILCHGEMV